MIAEAGPRWFKMEALAEAGPWHFRIEDFRLDDFVIPSFDTLFRLNRNEKIGEKHYCCNCALSWNLQAHYWDTQYPHNDSIEISWFIQFPDEKPKPRRLSSNNSRNRDEMKALMVKWESEWYGCLVVVLASARGCLPCPNAKKTTHLHPAVKTGTNKRRTWNDGIIRNRKPIRLRILDMSTTKSGPFASPL